MPATAPSNSARVTGVVIGIWLLGGLSSRAVGTVAMRASRRWVLACLAAGATVSWPDRGRRRLPRVVSWAAVERGGGALRARRQACRANCRCIARPNTLNPSRITGLGMYAGPETTWMRNSTAPLSSHFQTS